MTQTQPTHRGRPTEYDAETFPDQANKWAAEGLTLQQIADRLGVGRRTVARWKREHPEFRAAINEDWEEASDPVVTRLYKLALGFDHTEKRVITDANGNLIRTSELFRPVPPNYRAVALWLSNHCGREWSLSGQHPEPEPPPREPTPYDNMTVEQLMGALRLLSG